MDEGGAGPAKRGFEDQVEKSAKRLNSGLDRSPFGLTRRRQAQVDLEKAIKLYVPAPPFQPKRTGRNWIRIGAFDTKGYAYEVSNMNLAGFPGTTEEEKRAHDTAYQNVRDLAVAAGMEIGTATKAYPPGKTYEYIKFVPAHTSVAYRALLNAVSEELARGMARIAVEEGAGGGVTVFNRASTRPAEEFDAAWERVRRLAKAAARAGAETDIEVGYPTAGAEYFGLAQNPTGYYRNVRVPTFVVGDNGKIKLARSIRDDPLVYEFQLVVDEGINSGYLRVLVPFEVSLEDLAGNPRYYIAPASGSTPATNFLDRLEEMSRIVEKDETGVGPRKTSLVMAWWPNRRLQTKYYMEIPPFLASQRMLEARELGTQFKYAPENTELENMAEEDRKRHLEERIAAIEGSPYGTAF
jgi:hypothetical protein